jgi:hypothetical protein
MREKFSNTTAELIFFPEITREGLFVSGYVLWERYY